MRTTREGAAVTTFEVWAPDAGRVRLRVITQERDHYEMIAAEDGWWRLDVPETTGPVDYAYLLGDDPTPLPDPRSPWQPEGVHGPSRRYDHSAFAWADERWTGRQLPGSVLYELHIGTFTPEGTFDAAISRLDHLVELGVDLVEVLPINAFNGVHNWGYDGVCWYAVHDPYGGPDGFKRFVDACHRRGLGVVLDVVYNHLGPSGAYLPRFGPYLAQGSNSWGQSINLDGPGSDEVRRYIIDNALMWLRDYHVDGLRLDAVHALVDHRAMHLLEELAREVEVLRAHLRRPLSLIAESDLNDPRLVTAREAGGYGLHATWDDDVHHAVHALLTGERQGYYADFGSLECLATVMTGAYYHAGTWSSFRRRVHGRPVDRANIPGHRFVVSLQNHDQIGNRATGDRLSATQPPGLLKVGAALMLTSPYTPMLFMGEEWAASTPWQFFTSHPEPDLGEATARGRVSEFAEHGWPSDAVPDPQDPATFAASTLDWSELDGEPHKDVLDFYRKLVALRRAHPDLTDPRLDAARVTYSEAECWLVVRRGRFAVAVNLAAERQRVPLERAPIDVLLASERWVVLASHAVELPPQSVAILDLG
jgi:maltooligosyltrehalose trehalohydrolase